MNTITGHTTMKYEDFISVVPPRQDAWDWYTLNKNGDVHIFEDTLLPTHIDYDGKIKIAFLLEVPSIYDAAKKCNSDTFHPFEWIVKNYQHFDYIISPYRYLENLVGKDKYMWALAQCCFIPRDQFGLYEKEKTLSAIASTKNWTDGHQMRHKVIRKFHSQMDIYGSGYNNLINSYGKMGKIIALAPYCFTIVVPNTNIDDFFSEQVTDAMAVGTIPVFCGTKNIGKYFNLNGIIQFDTIDELESIIPTLSKELYESKMLAVKENLELSKKYICSLDWLYENKKEFLENIKT